MTYLLMIHAVMGVDHKVDRGTRPPTFWSMGDVMCFVPPLLIFLREQVLMFQIYKIMTVSAQPLIGIKHNNAQ